MTCPPTRYYPHLSIEEYWEFLQINECAAWGIRNFPDKGDISLGCGDYWDQENRYFLAASIKKSEERLKADRWLGFPVRREYFTARQLDYDWPVYLGKYVRGTGVETQTAIEIGKALTLSVGGVINDPVEFTVTVDFTDENEVVIYYPDETNCPIRPSSVVISGTTATIQIPRCRLLKGEHHKNYENDQDRPDYEDDTNFVSTVDVYRNYLDTSTGANLVWWRHQGQINCIPNSIWTCNPQGACADVKQLACSYIRSQRDGFVQLEPATYNGGYSKAAYAVSHRPDGVEVAFMKGYYERYQEIDADLKRAIIAMAHNNLPKRYCSCDVQSLWYEDDTRPLEPAVRLKSGRSTWGLYEMENIIREFDRDRNSHNGGML